MKLLFSMLENVLFFVFDKKQQEKIGTYYINSE